MEPTDVLDDEQAGADAEEAIEEPGGVEPEEAIHDAFEDVEAGVLFPEATHVLASDGLPKPIDNGMETAMEGPLDPSTLVCMEDAGRPKCQHYARQMLSLGNDYQHQHVYRLCTARLSRAGAFVDVSGGVWACDLREPRDLISSKRLDEFDARKVREGRERRGLPLFRDR